MIWLLGQNFRYPACFFDYDLTMILVEHIIFIVKFYE
ncbi:hypothetical protein NIES22_41970 [Calothrix brevissima NIES-22]|nr:hypothetical protein NIES22_41970 [Calothrix brevissima NIES-22]